MTYKPVSFEKFKEEALRDPAVKSGYDELEEEFSLIAELIKARKIARKTQQDVAKSMHTSQAMIARIENGFSEKRNSPTLGTIRRYARAVGCRLSIKLIPEGKCQPAR